MPEGGVLEVVARLSDTCSACRWSVPVLNDARARAAGDGLVFRAEIAGEAERFVEETGLQWDVRAFGPPIAAQDRRERLPNIVIHGSGREPLHLEAEHFDQLQGLLETLGAEPTADAQVAPDAEALAARLAEVSATARALGDVPADVGWIVTDALSAVSQAAVPHRAAVALTTFSAARAVDGQLDPVMALVTGEAVVFGDAEVAGRMLAALDDAVAAHREDHVGLLDDAAPADDDGGGASLRRVAPDAPAAACLTHLSTARRSVVFRRLWTHQRAVSELQAEVVRKVYAGTLDRLGGRSC